MSGPGDPDWEGGALARRSGDRFDAGWTRDMRLGWLDEDERLARGGTQYRERQVPAHVIERSLLDRATQVQCDHSNRRREGDEYVCMRPLCGFRAETNDPVWETFK